MKESKKNRHGGISPSAQAARRNTHHVQQQTLQMHQQTLQMQQQTQHMHHMHRMGV